MLIMQAPKKVIPEEHPPPVRQSEVKAQAGEGDKFNANEKTVIKDNSSSFLEINICQKNPSYAFLASILLNPIVYIIFNTFLVNFLVLSLGLVIAGSSHWDLIVVELCLLGHALGLNSVD